MAIYMKILLVLRPLGVKRGDQKALPGNSLLIKAHKMLTCHSSLHSTVTLLCNDEILELSSTPVSSQACSHVSPGGGDDHEDGHEEGPQPWVAADNGGSDIPVAVGIFVATVVGTPVKLSNFFIIYSCSIDHGHFDH